MKHILIILLTIISLNSFSQNKMNEKQAIKEKHIDFTTQHLYFELSGLIELDGVIFKNDTCQCPIVYTANINKVKIFNKCTKEEYVFNEFITYGEKKIISINELVDINGNWNDLNLPYFFTPTNEGIITLD